jgi:hypothetical protein
MIGASLLKNEQKRNASVAVETSSCIYKLMRYDMP